MTNLVHPQRIRALNISAKLELGDWDIQLQAQIKRCLRAKVKEWEVSYLEDSSVIADLALDEAVDEAE